MFDSTPITQIINGEKEKLFKKTGPQKKPRYVV